MTSTASSSDMTELYGYDNTRPSSGNKPMEKLLQNDASGKHIVAITTTNELVVAAAKVERAWTVYQSSRTSRNVNSFRQALEVKASHLTILLTTFHYTHLAKNKTRAHKHTHAHKHTTHKHTHIYCT